MARREPEFGVVLFVVLFLNHRPLTIPHSPPELTGLARRRLDAGDAAWAARLCGRKKGTGAVSFLGRCFCFSEGGVRPHSGRPKRCNRCSIARWQSRSRAAGRRCGERPPARRRGPNSPTVGFAGCRPFCARSLPHTTLTERPARARGRQRRSWCDQGRALCVVLVGVKDGGAKKRKKCSEALKADCPRKKNNVVGQKTPRALLPARRQCTSRGSQGANPYCRRASHAPTATGPALPLPMRARARAIGLLLLLAAAAAGQEVANGRPRKP